MNNAKKALWVMMEAKPGKEKELESFLSGAKPLAEKEAFTLSWYAIRIGPSMFGIYDTFADDAGRDKHLAGPIAAALMAKAPDLLAKPPSIEKLDILAAK